MSSSRFFLIVSVLMSWSGSRCPAWLLGGLALVAGIMLLFQRFGLVRKP